MRASAAGNAVEHLHAALQGDGRTASSGPGRRRLRDALVVGEIALSALLVVGAGLLVRSLHNLRVVDPGFRSEHVMKLQFRLPASRYPQSFSDYPDWSAIIGFHREILERTSALPGARSVALAGYHPLDPGFTNSFVIEGRARESIHRDGRWWDELAMSVLEPDWRRLKASEAETEEERQTLLAEAEAAESAGYGRGRWVVGGGRSGTRRRTPELVRRTIRRFT